MSEHFSERTREAVLLAGQEARELGHGALQDGHLLLGLLHGRRGLAAKVLRRSGVHLKTAREALRTARARPAVDEMEPLPLELSAKRAVQLALHEAFERNDGPIRASYLLIGTLTVDGSAANLVRAQGATPRTVIDAAKAKLPGADRVRGTELLEDHLALLDAYIAATTRSHEVARVISTTPDRTAAAAAIAALLGLSEAHGVAVANMPLDMAARDGVEALEAERRDLEQRLVLRNARSDCYPPPSSHDRSRDERETGPPAIQAGGLFSFRLLTGRRSCPGSASSPRSA